MEKLRSDVISNVRGCLISTKGRLSLRQLNNDYCTLIGERIPYQKLGYSRLDEFIQSENTLHLTKSGAEIYVDAKTTEKSAHITEMVAKQKSAKRQPRVRFQYRPPPNKFDHTSKWRPKKNTNNNQRNYHFSMRPQSVSHSQFINYQAPSVASKIVVPDYSTLNNNKSNNLQQPQKQINHRLTTHRLKENINNISVSNPVINGTSNNLVQSHAPKAKPTPSAVLPLAQINQAASLEKSVDSPLASARRRINKKMSELSLERDSGNSSPTGEILPPLSPKIPDLIRTDNPLADLESFAEMHKLGEVDVSVVQMNTKRNKFYTCKIKVGIKHTYTSYPKECRNPLEAKHYCCEQALADLIPKCRQKCLMISSEKDILERIPPMLEKHNHGIWSWQLKYDYSDKFNEILPDDWLKIIDMSSCVQIENISSDYVLYHCRPGDKGQHRIKGVPVLNVSVPSNTVQFGEDGKLIGQVTCVLSTNEIWCQQVATEESELYVEMMERLDIFYKGHETKLIPERISTAGYYIAKHDEVYYRVRAVTVNENEVHCFFIDWGEEMSIPKSDMFELRKEYASAQAQAFVCRLFGLEELSEASSNSASLSALVDRQVVVEMAVESSENNSTNDVLPVYMYDCDTGLSINQELIPKLTMESASPTLHKDAITEVYISNIEQNGDIYVQTHTVGYETLQVLRGELEEQIKANPPKDIMYKVTKENSQNKLYFMKNKVDGGWHRIKLNDWSTNKQLPNHAQIYFVDVGHTDVINVLTEDLYPLESLSDIFNNYPYQAVRVGMSLEKIPSNFVDLASKALPKDQPVLLKIVGHNDQNLPLVELFKRSSDDELICINKSIALETELNDKKEDVNILKGKLKLRLNPTACVPSAGELLCPTLPEIEQYFMVQVPFAISPYNFFIQPLDSKADLNAMMRKLQERFADVRYGGLTVNDVLPGHIYASKHTDGFWYRTSVIKVIHSGSVSVFFCDFGYYQTLPVKQLIPLDEEFMELPYQALKAKLSDVKPKQSKWTMEDCEEFKELIEKKQFFALLRNIEKDILYESDIVLKVLLVDTYSKDDDIYIGNELITRGMAIPD